MADIRFSRRQCGEISLHVAEAGPADGPLVVLLHGFPEFWFGWRHQIPALADAGYRVVAPDQRGYNLSDRPKGIAAYDLDRLRADVFGLADSCGAQTFSLVGHDWGAAAAWWTAHGDDGGRIRRLAVMNAPHPAIWRRAMDDDPEQRKLSWYVRALGIPVLPELLVRLGAYRALADALKDASIPPSNEELARYREAWARPGALTGMINWYRAILRRRFQAPRAASIAAPTAIIWGQKDKYSLASLADASAKLCREAKLIVLPEATHWVPHDEPERVNALLLDHLR